jgi:hypothetical protein
VHATNRGKVLIPLKRLKYIDAFRMQHPEQKVYTRVGAVANAGALHTYTYIHILLSWHSSLQNNNLCPAERK